MLRQRADRSQRRGAALMEFALALPFFLILLLGIMEFASVFFVRHVMLNAARDATRSYSIGDLSSTDAQQRALALLPAGNYTVTTSPQTDPGLDRWVEVRLPMDEASLGDPLNVFSNSNLTVRVTMRREDL